MLIFKRWKKDPQLLNSNFIANNLLTSSHTLKEEVHFIKTILTDCQTVGVEHCTAFMFRRIKTFYVTCWNVVSLVVFLMRKNGYISMDSSPTFILGWWRSDEDQQEPKNHFLDNLKRTVVCVCVCVCRKFTAVNFLFMATAVASVWWTTHQVIVCNICDWLPQLSKILTTRWQQYLWPRPVEQSARKHQGGHREEEA